MFTIFKDVINRKQRYATIPVKTFREREDFDGPLEVCPSCGRLCHEEDEAKNFIKVCGECGYHFSMGAWERIASVTDEGTFEEFDSELTSRDPLQFPGYPEKLDRARQETGLREAIVTGKALLDGRGFVIGVMDSRFMMASMGSVVGEKITRAFERATEYGVPVVIFTASGGARMQEGMLSLMQMAKTSAAVDRFSRDGLLFLSVLTHPTTGGVTASFATLGDIIVAEPHATVGFLGAKVIEQTFRQKLPQGFQKSEFVRDHGMIDAVIDRRELRGFVSNMISIHTRRGQ